MSLNLPEPRSDVGPAIRHRKSPRAGHRRKRTSKGRPAHGISRQRSHGFHHSAMLITLARHVNVEIARGGRDVA